MQYSDLKKISFLFVPSGQSNSFRTFFLNCFLKPKKYKTILAFEKKPFSLNYLKLKTKLYLHGPCINLRPSVIGIFLMGKKIKTDKFIKNFNLAVISNVSGSKFNH